MGSSGVHRMLWEELRNVEPKAEVALPANFYSQTKGTDAKMAHTPSFVWRSFCYFLCGIYLLSFWFILAFGLLHSMNSLVTELSH